MENLVYNEKKLKYAVFNGVEKKYVVKNGQIVYQKQQGTSNLFDKNNYNYIAGGLPSRGNSSSWTSSSNRMTFYIPINQGKTYRIEKLASNPFRVAITRVVPTTSTMVYDFVQGGDNDTVANVTASDSQAKYLCLYVYHASDSTITLQQLLDSLVVTEE